MAGNVSLGVARAAKNDEFYTQWNDIENEMQAYLEHDPDVFRGKTVLLPCDDPEWSNFTRFFFHNFTAFGIKKLISTSYTPRGNGRICIMESGSKSDGSIEWKYLDGDGDFRSDEVTALRDEADMVITNPPFSLFREFMAWLAEGGVEFSVIGSMNAITYREIFPMIKNNQMWLGVTRHGTGQMWFRVPDDAPDKTGQRVDEDGVKYQTIGDSAWFTNIQHGLRHEPLQLMTMEDNLRFSTNKKIREHGYPEYENYRAIEVPAVVGIPSDYDGVMGVPITFVGKYAPDQFEILGASLFDATPMKEVAKPGDQFQQGGLAFYVREGESTLRRLYFRLIVRHRRPETEAAV